MEYTALAILSTIPKDPNIDKLEEPTETAKETAKPAKEPAEPAKDTTKNATLKERPPELFALSQDFEEDPVFSFLHYIVTIIRDYRAQDICQNTVMYEDMSSTVSEEPG
ncbi:hypothetical protein DSO57_1004195 [Entomophthora muscae]|uniref:Uncharacterized protein n=1 Tax=Entomophthora muscae TaxID=34485 RepID=A0ACC2UTS9_9FUNG|nr:hypothetical protein DSO57_1004195 [Entomophthora muscae]